MLDMLKGLYGSKLSKPFTRPTLEPFNPLTI